MVDEGEGAPGIGMARSEGAGAASVMFGFCQDVAIRTVGARGFVLQHAGRGEADMGRGQVRMVLQYESKRVAGTRHLGDVEPFERGLAVEKCSIRFEEAFDRGRILGQRAMSVLVGSLRAGSISSGRNERRRDL